MERMCLRCLVTGLLAAALLQGVALAVVADPTLAAHLLVVVERLVEQAVGPSALLSK